jgi:hypothetical protein
LLLSVLLYRFLSDAVKGKLQLIINGFSKYVGLKDKKKICSKQITYINKLPFKIFACLEKDDLTGDVVLAVYLDCALIDANYTNKLN